MKYTTKKTNTTSFILGLIFTAIIAYFAFYCHSLAEKAASLWQRNNEETLRTVSTVLFVFAGAELLSTILGFCSVANVSEKNISGYGLIYYGYALTSFNLPFDQIIDMSMSMNKLRIKTASKTYDVITSPDCGQKIIRYFHDSKK